MHGVTTAIVLFIFACVAYPKLVRNRPQFYAALGLVLLIIVIDSVGVTFPGLKHVAYFLNAILQVGAIAVLVLSTGGQTLSELTGEMANTIEVVRRGGEKETIIVPLTGEQPKPRTSGTTPPPRKPVDKPSIPLD